MRGGFRQFVFQKSVFLKHPIVQCVLHIVQCSHCTMFTLHNVCKELSAAGRFLVIHSEGRLQRLLDTF